MRRLRGESGLTLIEVLLAMALLGLVTAAIFSFYFSGVRTWRRGVDRMDCQQSARTAVDLVVRELRFADHVEIPAGGEIRFKLKGDYRHDQPDSYRRFRYAGDQLFLEEIRDGSSYSCNVVAQGISAATFSCDASSNVHITITCGGGDDAVTLQSSVRPRNLPDSKPEGG